MKSTITKVQIWFLSMYGKIVFSVGAWWVFHVCEWWDGIIERLRGMGKKKVIDGD